MKLARPLSSPSAGSRVVSVGHSVQILSTSEELSRSVITIRYFPLLIRYPISRAVSIVGNGVKTAPILMSAKVKDLPLVNVREHNHHAVALVDTELEGDAGSLVREVRKVKETVFFFSSPVWLTQIMASLLRSFRALASMTSKPKVSYPGISIWNFSQGFSYLSVPRPLLFMESGTVQSPDLFQCTFFRHWKIIVSTLSGAPLAL